MTSETLYEILWMNQRSDKTRFRYKIDKEKSVMSFYEVNEWLSIVYRYLFRYYTGDFYKLFTRANRCKNKPLRVKSNF